MTERKTFRVECKPRHSGSFSRSGVKVTDAATGEEVHVCSVRFHADAVSLPELCITVPFAESDIESEASFVGYCPKCHGDDPPATSVPASDVMDELRLIRSELQDCRVQTAALSLVFALLIVAASLAYTLR